MRLRQHKIAAMFLLSESYIRIGCVNHAFHNVVGDGLKGAGARGAIAWQGQTVGLLYCTTL